MIPLELFLKIVCPHGQFCFWKYEKELLPILLASPENEKLFHIEHTTAAEGPYVLWYPLSRWHEEEERQKQFNELIYRQYAPQKTKNDKLKEQIQKARSEGNEELAKILESAL